MNDEQSNSILVYHDYFVLNMADVKKVCDFLLSSGRLTQDMVEVIMTGRPCSDRVHVLNTLICAFNEYYEELNMSGNEEMAQRLEPFLMSRLPTVQGAMEELYICHGATSSAHNTGVPPSSSSSSPHQDQHIVISYQATFWRILMHVRDVLWEHWHNIWMDVDNITGNIKYAMAAAVKNFLVAGLHTSKINDEERNDFLVNRDYFVTNRADVKKVRDYLLSSGTLTQDKVEEIMAKKARSDKVHVLNTLMPKRHTFNEIDDAMNESGNEELAQHLELFLPSRLPMGEDAIGRLGVGDGGRLMTDQRTGGTG